MSSRRKKKERLGGEFESYATPAWCVDRLLDYLGDSLPRGMWHEPAVGEGAIVRAVDKRIPGLMWTVGDIQPGINSVRAPNSAGIMNDRTGIDFLQTSCEVPSDVLITNPPFSKAQAFVEHSLREHFATWNIFLLRLSFLEGAKRQSLFKWKPPTMVCVLPDRTSFTNDGCADSSAYAWFVWVRMPTKSTELVLLETTPKSIRLEGKIARPKKIIAEVNGADNDGNHAS